LPGLAALDAETCYLTYDLEILSTSSRADISAVFDFVAEGSVIQINCLNEQQAPAMGIAPAPSLPTAAQPLQSSPAAAPARSRDRNGRDNTLIKVEARKLDELIDAVGELVIRNASCQAHPGIRQNPSLMELVEGVGELVAQIRD